ncbi:MAG TPA: hypothetical protein VIE37_21120 [Methylomirabilota bacterium]|jgi:hypothetical protein
MLDEGAAWLSRNVVVLVAGYVIVTAATILILMVVLAVLPATYFQDGAEVQSRRRRGGLNVLVRLAKNALGIVLIVLGFLLSLPAIPGQGVLTMLIGVILVDFPGKRALEQKLVARPRVLETMNRLRAWLGRPPLVL